MFLRHSVQGGPTKVKPTYIFVCKIWMDSGTIWSRRSCWSGAHCHRGSLMVVSTSGGVACRVSYRRMVDILNTSSTSCRHLYSSIVVCCRRYKRWTICRSATYDFFQVVCLRQSCWSYVAPSSVLSVYYDKICIKFASHHLLLYVVYMCQKSLNFTYAFKCYHQKCKWSLNQNSK